MQKKGKVVKRAKLPSSFSYNSLEKKGIRVVKDKVLDVDSGKKTVRTS
jgi:hypothetical protein